MFNYDYWVTVRGGSGGKTFFQDFDKGRITMSGTDKDGTPFKHIVLYENRKIKERIYKENGSIVNHLVYGSYEKDRHGIVHFRKGTMKGKHGKARTFEMLFGKKGCCHSWYSCGRLTKQKFVYDNGVTAYLWKGNKPFTVKDYYGKKLYEVTGKLKNALCNSYNGSHTVLDFKMENWFLESSPFEVKKEGKVWFAGKVENRQRVGMWVIEGKQYFFEHGVQIPKELYETPPEKYDVKKLLKLDNAQLKMALLSKVTPDRIAKCGTVVHKEKDMELFDIRGFADFRILKVCCPSTKAKYFLRVPKNARKCEQARQWTFGVGDKISKPIKFEVET